ncbi:glycine-rich RNA-binding protein 8-like [Cimex lectularius]|uniref:CPR type cuticle protein n=1 Tax=Cimex lectularius TaxID=79782 RepID=A0A8I6SCI9_CIMLE|nr:glycine-rich RNA-binding protein 8-like [Cimex lectularius]
MLLPLVLLPCLGLLASGLALPTSPPDPLNRALTDPNFVPPKDDLATARDAPVNGPLAQGLLAPLNQGEDVTRTKRHHCHKCSSGAYGGGGYGGGYVVPSKVVVVPVSIQKGWGGGGYGHKGGRGGCLSGCGGDRYEEGGGYPVGGGGGGSWSHSQASSSSGSSSWGKK